jgi:phosphoribosylanthranilate isomerase
MCYLPDFIKNKVLLEVLKSFNQTSFNHSFNQTATLKPHQKQQTIIIPIQTSQHQTPFFTPDDRNKRQISVKMPRFTGDEASVNTRTRVKICGLTHVDDAVQAARLGVDAIGLVFYANSPRNVTLQQARLICDALPGFVSVVSLFMNPDTDQVNRVLDACPIDLIQFHGAEQADFCASFSRPYIKAVGMADGNELAAALKCYAGAKALLLDSHGRGGAGGTGETFAWDTIPVQHRSGIILAGGLNAANVAAAIREVRPYAVDLSSGVESAPGRKDATLMAQLMNEVRRVDSE